MIPASGPLSMDTVLAELGYPAGTSINLNDQLIRALAGANLASGSAFNLSSLYDTICRQRGNIFPTSSGAVVGWSAGTAGGVPVQGGSTLEFSSLQRTTSLGSPQLANIIYWPQFAELNVGFTKTGIQPAINRIVIRNALTGATFVGTIETAFYTETLLSGELSWNAAALGSFAILPTNPYYVWIVDTNASAFA